MAPVTQILEWPQYQARRPERTPRRPSATAEIVILPCIRRERIETTDGAKGPFAREA